MNDDDDAWPPLGLEGSGPAGWTPEGPMEDVHKTFHQELVRLAVDAHLVPGRGRPEGGETDG